MMTDFMANEDWVAVGIPEPIVEQAMSWIVLLDAGDVTEHQQQAFSQWLEEDLLHKWAYQELTELWAASASVQAVDVGVAHLREGAATAVSDSIKWWQSALTVTLMVVGIVMGVIS